MTFVIVYLIGVLATLFVFKYGAKLFKGENKPPKVIGILLALLSWNGLIVFIVTSVLLYITLEVDYSKLIGKLDSFFKPLFDWLDN